MKEWAPDSGGCNGGKGEIMDTVFAKQQIESFVQDLNSAKPMPGGGSAAAIWEAAALLPSAEPWERHWQVCRPI